MKYASRTAAGIALWVGALGCGSKEPPRPLGGAGGDDASADAAHDDDPRGAGPGTGSGFATFPDAGGALQAHLQVNGEGTVCGGCQILLAQANGGTPPYHYSWSDPALDGPGPHTVCPAAPARYAVVVTDSSGTSGSEISTPDERAEAARELTCEPGDGGATLSGCRVLEDKPDARIDCGGDGGNRTDDGGAPLWDFYSTPIDVPPTGGVPFEYDYDQLLPFSLGAASYVDVFGADLPCGADQKLFTIKLDSDWHQSFCVTASREFRYSTTKVHVNGFPFSFTTTATLCGSCSKEAAVGSP